MSDRVASSSYYMPIVADADDEAIFLRDGYQQMPNNAVSRSSIGFYHQPDVNYHWYEMPSSQCTAVNTSFATPPQAPSPESIPRSDVFFSDLSSSNKPILWNESAASKVQTVREDECVSVRCTVILLAGLLVLFGVVSVGVVVIIIGAQQSSSNEFRRKLAEGSSTMPSMSCFCNGQQFEDLIALFAARFDMDAVQEMTEASGLLCWSLSERLSEMKLERTKWTIIRQDLDECRRNLSVVRSLLDQQISNSDNASVAEICSTERHPGQTLRKVAEFKDFFQLLMLHVKNDLNDYRRVATKVMNDIEAARTLANKCDEMWQHRGMQSMNKHDNAEHAELFKKIWQACNETLADALTKKSSTAITEGCKLYP